MLRISFLLIGLLGLTACASVERVALPRATLLAEDWRAIAAEPSARVNYADYNTFLAKHHSVDAQGVARLSYSKVTPQDRARLERFLRQLQSIDPGDLTRDAQLAYWINLYNAQTIRVILQNYPVDSIREITDGPLSFGPWDRKDVVVNGQALSLNDIEHRIIRPVFNEPRIHFALNCAASGCPNLAPQAWRAAGLDAALEAAERSYLNDPRGVSVGPDGRITASKIFIWFREDFGASEADVVARLIAKTEPERRAALQARGRIDRYEYDWSLNDKR